LGVPVSARFRFAAVVGGALLVGFGSAAPAFADEWSVKDPAHDLYGYCDDGEDCPAGGVDPTRTDGDMGTTKVTHGSRNLVVKTHFVGLSKPSKWGIWAFVIGTNEDRTYKVQVILDDDGDQVTYLINAKKNEVVSCSDRRTSIDFDTNIIQVRIPRSCLSSPVSVRLGSLYYQRGTSANGLTGYIDRSISGWSTHWIKHD
jgi:hypothetical protein